MVLIFRKREKEREYVRVRERERETIHILVFLRRVKREITQIIIVIK